MENFNLSYHVIDRCNKNCVACGHYAPLASPNDKGVGVEQFRKDMELCKFLKPYVDKFYLTGGEPTLHENLDELMKISVEYFDNVWLMSNTLDMEFFKKNAELINNLGIHVILTNYNKQRCLEISDILGYVEWFYIPRLDDEEGNREKFNSKHIARNEVNAELLMCERGNCVQLREGKLYMCQVAANLHLLKSYFGEKVSEFSEEGTYVDLEKYQDIDYVEYTLFRKCPDLCKHCNEPFFIKDIKDNSIPLRASKRELSEWIEEE